MIVVVDYGCGNLASIHKMLRKAGFESTISAQPDDVLRADKIILPGVGHFDHGMKELESRGLVAALERRVVRERTPALGICLGAQLFARRSEEGDRPGLGWIAADVRRFDASRMDASLKVPHMGWADVEIARGNPLVAELPPGPRFYFVHAYHLVCDHEEDVLMYAQHGYRFVAAVGRGNVRGVQFHPEKSHAFGLALLKSFAQSA